ncbi:MAG: hypothetical protein RJB13_801, partial [Pseudomonadota bacterium]
MRVVDTYARKAGTEMLSLIFLSFRMVLVAFIALACVSCSLFPKKELSGTAEERPKVAQGIIASLNSFNASLESLYTSIARGLDESVLSKLDQFIVDGSQKSQVTTEQVAYIKIGLDILVDLRAARVPPAEFEHALDSLRTTLVLFNLQTLQYIQIVGRTQLPSGASLTDALSSSENTLALSLSTVADIARRAGIDAKNDVSFEVSELVKKKVSAFEQLLSTMKPEAFLYLQPYLTSALKIEKPFGESMGIEAQQLFALAIAENGLLLAGALQTQRDGGQIDNNSYINTLKLWSVEIQSKSEIAANSGVIPVLGSIPDKAPSLIEGTGGLPEGNEGWEFVLVEKPTLGNVDLSKNPPEYTPTETLGFSIDRYGFRACLKIIPAFCTSSFSVVVQTPVKPWTINIKTSQGVPTQFRRGDTIVCSAELQSATQTPIFRWTLIRTEPSFSAEVTQWQVQPGQLSVPNSITPGGSELDVREGDKITCEVAARDSKGLQSPYSAPSLATMYAVNSAASDIYLAQNNAAFDENIVDRLGDAIPTITDSIDLIVDDLDPNSDPFLEIVDCDGQGVVDCPFVVEQHADNIPNQSGRYTARIKRRASKILNYELKSFYDLLFKVVDGNEQLLKTLRLNVSDRNELVTDVTPAQITIAEGSNVEEKLSTIDVDCELESQCQASGYTYAFAQEDCPACTYFEITGENNRFLKNKINLDYEDLFATVEADSRYGTVDAAERVVTLNVKMIVTENTSESEYNHGEFQRTISVIVEDTNEKPTKISFSRSLEIPLGGDDFSLNENTPNTTVLGELSIEDPDLEENPDAVMYTMTLVSPGISGKEILKISGRKIEIGSDTNFEEFEEFADSGVVELTYLITAQDERGETYSESFIFKLMDVNEQPTNVYFSGPGDPSSRFIQGSKSDDRTVVSPNATLSLAGDDPDGDSLSFEIVTVKGVPFDPSSADHPFEIVDSSIRPTRPLNYSEPEDRRWEIKVRARDPGLEYEDQLLEINLIEITPTDIDISENIEPQAIGRFCVNVELDESNPNCIGWVFSI